MKCLMFHFSSFVESVFFGSIGINVVNGLSVAIGLISDFEPGLTPGAEEGGAPLLLLGDRTCVVTGFNTVVFASTDSSFLIGFSTAIF